MTRLEKLKSEFATDETLSQAARLSKRGAREFPRAALRYVVEKAPIFQWIPRYSLRWILNDLIAGLTVGILLIPQGLSYAKIATIPVEIGLTSSWLPAAIYAFMGTSKELSTGPTSIIGLLTADIVADMNTENIAPQVTASAVAMMVGVYALVLGLFKLGFLLDYISAPVLTGFVSAAAIVIILGQVPSLFGLDNVGSGTANVIHDVLTQLGDSNWRTVVVGLTGIILLQLLQFAGTKWGKKSKIILGLSIARAAIALAIFTGMSYGVNKNLKTPLFAISKVKSSGVPAPKMPETDVIKKIATKAFAPFVAAALEHIAIGKAFGAKNGYAIDPSQELTYLGVTNFFNSFFSSMTVGGAMSRTAVASNANVKSPLSGLVTAGFVLLGIYKLTPALYWIPKATLAAIIVTAVYHLIGPASHFYKFWRTSLADFVASMICFWVTLFVSAENGIAFAVLFSVAYTLLRNAFSSVTVVNGNTRTQDYSSTDLSAGSIPVDTEVFRFDDSILFPNAYRAKDRIMENVLVYHTGLERSAEAHERSWSVAREKRIQYLRKRADIQELPPPIRVIVLDFTRVSRIDFTGLKALSELKSEIKTFAGNDAELRFVGLTDAVRARFARSDWQIVDVDGKEGIEQKVIGCYPNLAEAVWGVRRVSVNFSLDSEKV